MSIASSGTAPSESKTERHIEQIEQYSARNYAPLPVVIASGSGAWVKDVEGKRYLDMLSAYSALNFGHAHPRLTEVFIRQAGTLTLTSRAFHSDQFGPFCETITRYAEQDLVLPMNTGAEAVETALKAARKWGYHVKGVPRDRAEIIVCSDNFHGRTISIVSFSPEVSHQHDYGPVTPGFRTVPYGDSDALAAAITDHTVGFLVEPIQGEGGINVPPDGYLARCAEICRKRNVLLIVDEIQTGLGRTGRRFCCDHDGVKPDVLILGKALGGGMMPVSAVLSRRDVLGVFQPGDHGSTFGGNPLACAVARCAIEVLRDEKLAERSARLGAQFMEQLRSIPSKIVRAVRGRGLLIGIELVPEAGGGKAYCKKLLREGVLCKETSDHVIRIAPPLTIGEEDLTWSLERFARVLGAQ